MNKSESINELASALAKAQGVMEGASKSSTNPHFRSRYADLASVVEAYRKPLADNGLALTQLATASGPEVRVETVLMHSSGQWLSSELVMTAAQNTPQAIGSAITYARRYGAMAAVGIAPEDDDGEAAEAPRPQVAPAPQVRTNFSGTAGKPAGK